MPLVSQQMIEAVFEYLNEQCEAAAQAKADVIIAERRVTSTRARLMLEAPHTTGEMRKAWAESHADYLAACNVEFDANKRLEWHRRQQARADAITSAWQTESANRRNLSRVA